MQEVEVVQVHGNNLVLGVVALQLDSYHPLDRFLQHALHDAVGRTRIQLLGQLLRDGRAAASRLLSQQSSLDDSTSEGYEVNARVVVEAHVLGSHQRLYQRGCQLGVVYQYAVLTIVVPRTHDFSVSGIYLCGKSVDGVLQVLDGRHVAYPAPLYSHESKRCRQHDQQQQCPQNTYYNLSHDVGFNAN